MARQPSSSRVYVFELGGEDDRFAACEARSVAADVEVTAPGLALAESVDLERVRALAYTRGVSAVVGRARLDGAGGTDPVETARTLLDAAPLDRDGTVAVRARNVRDTAGVDTLRAERTLGQVLVDRGFRVDLDSPDNELRALFSAGEVPRTSGASGQRPRAGGAVVLGWLTAESVRDYGARRPTRKPFFQPGSMDPLDARALVNVAGARPGAIVLDPMCGTGGVLVEAGLVGARVLGADAQRKMAAGAAENLAHFLGSEEDFHTLRGDATHLPLPDDAVDAVVFDAPYGRQSKVANLDLPNLVAGALTEARRVAPRAVVVGDRSWADAAREVGWVVDETFERRVHRSLTRYVVVLSRRDDDHNRG